MTVEEMLNCMLDYIPNNYDVSVGSFFYDLLYPVAERLTYLFEKVNYLKSNVFALTAQGEYLDYKVAEQGLIRHAAEYAKGVVRISGARGAIVQAGSLVAADTTLFSVDKTATISELGYVDVGATCTVAGDGGNVKAGEINRFPITLPDITSVINTLDFEGGYDAESDDDLRTRYFEKVSRPNASGNKYQYEAWAKEVSSGIGSVKVIPLYNGNGTVKVIITDAKNQPASDELIAEVKEYIEEHRPIGASVSVESAKSISIDIAATLVKSVENIDMQNFEHAVINYFSNVALGKQYVSYAKIGSLLLDIEGVEDYSGLMINNKTSNIAFDDGVIPVLGKVVIT